MATIVSTSGTVDQMGFRLTTESGVPISTTDRTAQGTIYLTPFTGSYISLYNGNSWDVVKSAEVSIALSGLTAAKNYDVFAYNNAGTLTLELSAAWASDTSRTDALTTVDGIYVKSGTTTRRLVGTFRSTGTGTTQDSAGTVSAIGKRFLWNAYNRVNRHLIAADSTDSWSYTTATIRQARASTANQVEYVVGLSEDIVQATVYVTLGMAGNTTGAGRAAIGVDTTQSTSGVLTTTFVAGASAVLATLNGNYRGYPGIGYHYLAWLEGGVDTFSTFYGDNGGPSLSGLQATIMD